MTVFFADTKGNDIAHYQSDAVPQRGDDVYLHTSEPGGGDKVRYIARDIQRQLKNRIMDVVVILQEV